MVNPRIGCILLRLSIASPTGISALILFSEGHGPSIAAIDRLSVDLQ